MVKAEKAVKWHQNRVLKLVKLWRKEAADWPGAFPHELKLYRAVIELEEAEKKRKRAQRQKT